MLLFARLLRCKKVAGSHPAPWQVKGQFKCCLQVPPTVSGVEPAKEKVLSTSVVPVVGGSEVAVM